MLLTRSLIVAQLTLGVWLSLSWQASGQSVDVAGSGVEFFEKQIRPLLVEHCYECHSQDKTQGGLRLDSRSGLRQGGDSGASLNLEKPEDSLLLRAVRYDQPELQMPPKGKLPEAQLAALEAWVQMGAPDPRSDSIAASSSRITIEEGKAFWSFRPISLSEIPRVKRQDWVQTPVDAFILDRLERMGLAPASLADRSTWIRRVTWDLIGLPPTMEEVDRFLQDDSPDADARLVDRLLASPAYGQRWGRHWLDVARYADSNGLDENIAFGTAWRYRDYVVDSFNRDKPWNRFVQEQVAGDLLSDVSLESRIGTGFLVLGAKVLAEPDRDKLTMDTVDEQLDTLGKAFLGLTLGCARCHDHKFDPIQQSDYYGLAGILLGTKTFGDTNFGAIKHWNEYVFATPEESRALADVEKEIAAKQKLANDYKSQAMQRLRAKVRGQAAAYLAEACRFGMDASLADIATIAEQRGLHPRVLHHCRRHLEFHRGHPFFERWHQLAPSQSVAEIESHYQAIFLSVEDAWKRAREQDPMAARLEDASLEMVRNLLDDPSGFLTIPAKPGFAFDEPTLQEYYRLCEEARLVESFAPDLPSAMSVCEGTIATSTPMHIRGNHRQPGKRVERRFPEVFGSNAAPVFPKHQSGRWELAQWLTDPGHPLTARVLVNRIWGWHFGEGLVRTTENFGVLGEEPSHPELLDWLARETISQSWSLKSLHRMILLSSTYRMASYHEDQRSMELDADMRWLSRFPIRRLDAEQIRDGMLQVTGKLDHAFGGKSIPLRNRQFVFDHTSIDNTKYESSRRALYLPVVRNNLYSLFEQFDFPDPTMPTGHRSTSTVAPQALWLLNNELVLDASDTLARYLMHEGGTPEEQIEILFEKVHQRRPVALEVERTLRFLESEMQAVPSGKGAEDWQVEVWSMVIQSRLLSNEFFFVR